MGATIKDIARVAKVSHTTVSRALNNSPFIKEDTKEKILRIAKELDYVPNYNAKALVTLKSNNIGVFFSSINDGTSSSFFHEIIKGIDEVIHNEYNLVIRGIDEYEKSNVIDRNNFDGIIVVSQSKDDDKFITETIKKEIPMIIINRIFKGNNLYNILSDDTKGAYEAITYLIEKNKKKIALIEGNTNFESNIYRKRGYLKALEENNVEINNHYIIKGKYTLENGYKAMKELLGLKNRPEAVFCGNDDIAIGAIKAIKESNLNIPKDISVIGFDNSKYCEYITPTLTSVVKDSYKMSKVSAEKLLQIINNETLEDGNEGTILIEPKLILRDSTE